MTLLNPEFSSRRSDVGRYAESPILAGTNRIAAPMPSSDSTVAGNVPEEARDDSATSVGLLFVHGIGEQKKGDTLVSFAEPLYEWLSRWSAGKSNDLWSVSTADAKITQTDDGAPSHVRVSAERNDSDTKIDILMAEAWWADAFAPPSYTQVARWALLVAPAVVGAYLRPRIQSSQVEAAETLTSEEEVPVVWQLVMVFSPLFQLAIQYGPPLIGRFVIPAVLLIMGAFVLVALQVVIVALLILGFIPRVRASVARLQLYFANGFGDTLTLVERPLRYQAMLSQVLKDLDWLEERCDVVSVIAHSQGAVLANEVIAGLPGKVRNLVTLGGALSKLPTLRAALAHRGRTYGSLACRLSAVLAIGYHLLSAPLDLPTPDSWVLPVAAVSLIYVSMLIDSAWHATSLTPAEAIEGVAKPLPGVAWCDLIGDADPVPEGPLPPVTGAMTSEVQNTGSVARDHVSYLANTEQVLARIWQLILGQEVIAMDRGHIARARVGRRERVNDQRLWPKLVTVAGWVATIVAIGLDGTRAIGEWLLTPLTWLVGLVSPDAGSVVRTDTFLQLSLGSLAVLLGLITCACACGCDNLDSMGPEGEGLVLRIFGSGATRPTGLVRGGSNCLVCAASIATPLRSDKAPGHVQRWKTSGNHPLLRRCDTHPDLLRIDVDQCDIAGHNNRCSRRPRDFEGFELAACYESANRYRSRNNEEEGRRSTHLRCSRWRNYWRHHDRERWRGDTHQSSASSLSPRP